MQRLQYYMETFLWPFMLQLCFKYVFWDDWGTLKPFKELCGSVVLLVNYVTKQWNYIVSLFWVKAKGQLHPLLQNHTNSAHDSEAWVQPVL